MFSSVAYAQAAGAAAAKPGPLEMFFPLILIVFVFYFLIGRPQSKRLKEHKTFLETVKRGDQVVTSSGIIGEITGLTEKVVTLEIAENVRIKILKSQIAGFAKEQPAT